METFLSDLIQTQQTQGIESHALVHGQARPDDPLAATRTGATAVNLHPRRVRVPGGTQTRHSGYPAPSAAHPYAQCFRLLGADPD